jgi:hypothetical protein
VPVYYPGTADPQAAAPVEVRPGTDLGGVDFTLARVAMRKVRGIVVDGTPGQPATSAAVMLVPRNASVTGPLPGRPSSDGTFEIPGVLPGSYFLAATARVNAGGNGIRIMGGGIPVEIGGSDLDRLALVLLPAADIAGRVTVEGLRDTAADDLHPTVTLKSDLAGIPGRLPQMYAQFSDGKQFVVNDVFEGDYQVQLTGLPPGTYAKSIRFGSVDVLNGGLRIDPRARDRLEIILGANSGVLDGIVVNKNREPIANAPVALVPDAAHRQRADLYRSTSTDEFGHFRLQGIPPGDFALFAWEDIEDGLWRDPEFIQRNEASGKSVRIVEGGRENIEITAIPFAF